jgi:phospho-N-acetylmuramoyl-pentapeptide-transferase
VIVLALYKQSLDGRFLEFVAQAFFRAPHLPNAWTTPTPDPRVIWLLGTALAAMALTVVLGAPFIRLMKRYGLVQRAYEDAPTTHAGKTGTATMGGILFLIGIGCVWFIYRGDGVLYMTAFAVSCMLIGVVDDFVAIRSGKNRGLRARTKLAATALVAFLFLPFAFSAYTERFALSWNWEHGGALLFISPGFAFHVSIIAWFVISAVTVLGTTHAVNLTDGLDGLAAGVILPMLLVLAFSANSSVAFIDMATFGALLGFLFFNRHPARLFMGDTGSLMLGGIIAWSAIVSGVQILLILIGGVLVAETLSVILQVASFKLTGKRIFRMSPLHHHFELLGWPETKVTHRFWAASALCSAAGAWLYFGWSPR